MRKLVEPGSAGATVIAEELELWARVMAFLGRREASATSTTDHDAELIELRDAIAEAKPEDVAPLVEQMTRISAVAAGRRGKAAAPIDMQTPYFGHLRLRAKADAGSPPGAPRDVLIGRRGIIDRQARVQIVDWRDAPVSQIYYRYEEGDDYEETISGGGAGGGSGGGGRLQGVVEVRRNVTILGGRLRRIGCPQGNFFCDARNAWWEAESTALPALQGGQGSASRAPRTRPQGTQPQPPRGRPHPGHQAPARLGIGQDRPIFAERVDKHLPEIAALIDAEQFALITEPKSGLVVIQGGAGSGKTTVALHRVAYLSYQEPQRFRPNKMLVIVPSEALARYVGGVLPALGVQGVPVLTSQAFLRNQRRRLLPRLPDRFSDETPPAVSRIKKHPRMLHVMERYVADQAASMREALAQALLSTPREQAAVLERWDALSALPLRSRCRAVRDALDKELLERPGDPPGDPQVRLRAEEALKRLSRRAHDVARDWAELLTDAGRLQEGLMGPGPGDPPGEQDVSEQDLKELGAWCKAQQEEVESVPLEAGDPERYQPVDGRPLDEGTPAGQLDVEDDALLLRLYQLKHGGLPTAGGGTLRYEHLVLDEAQDLSAIEVKTLLACMASPPGPEDPHRTPSVTVAGDVAQRLVFDNGFHGWEGLLQAVGISGAQAHLRHLRLLYRSTVEVMQLSREVLGPLATGESEQVATRSGAAVGGFLFSEVGEAVAFLGEALRSLLSREPTASVALIARHAGTADAYYKGLARSDVPSLRRVQRHEFPFNPGVDVTDVTQVKGLEFDYVVILDATAAAYPDAEEARHLLHIAITRCAHQLWLVAAGAPSPLVPPAYFGDPLLPSVPSPS